jgi:hypothetical protein
MSTDQLDLSAFAPDAPGWYPDPDGRHQYRYHDGSVWTDHVADDGQSAVDPRSPSLPPPVMPVMDDEVVVLEPDVAEPRTEVPMPELTEPPCWRGGLGPRPTRDDSTWDFSPGVARPGTHGPG